VTVSLDALDDATFERMSGVAGASVARVLDGIEAAVAAGLAPIKINCVVIRGVNEHAIEQLARRFHGTGCVLRFIEFMDVGTLNRWDPDQVVAAEEILARVAQVAPLEPVPAAQPGAVAERYRYTDGGGEIGVIASVTRPFCGGCNRARLSADGQLLTCLFASSGHSLRDTLRAGASDDELRTAIATVWGARTDRYSEQRSELRQIPRARHRLEMYQIGG
jgi:cyclic pyranopterin phosphate synthase